MKFRVRLTAVAEYQIESAAEWWAQHRSLEQALHWLRKINERIFSLADNPGRCALSQESARFTYEVRELLFGTGSQPTHRVLFRIIGDVVEVLMVRHVARDDLQSRDE